MADDLGRFVEDKPIRARRPALPERTRKWARRHQAVVWSAMVVVIMLGIGLVISTLLIGQERSRTARAYEAEKEQREEAQTQEQLAKEQQRRAERQRSLAEERELAVRRLLYAAHMKMAYQAWQRGNHNRLLQLVERYLPAAGQEDLRRFEWYYLWGLCHRELRVLNNTPSTLSPQAFSPDGEMLATGCRELQFSGTTSVGDSEVRLWELRTGKLRRRFTYILLACDITFSPDGTTLAVCGGDWFENFGSQGKVQLWDVRTGRELASLEAHTRFVTGVAFSPDGKTLATGSYDGSVKLWETDTWQERVTLDWDGQQIDHVVFSADVCRHVGATGPHKQPERCP